MILPGLKPCNLLALAVTNPDLELSISLIQDALGLNGDGPDVSPEFWRNLHCEERAVVLGEWLRAEVDAQIFADLQEKPYLTSQIASLALAAHRLYRVVKAGAHVAPGDPNFAELDVVKDILAEHDIDADQPWPGETPPAGDAERVGRG
jgi:hypothetical protein